MTLKACILALLVLAACSSGDSKGDLIPFLATELTAWGGAGEKLASVKLTGAWEIKRDNRGALIKVYNIDYPTLKNLFDESFGPGVLYARQSKDRGPILLYKFPEGATLSIANYNCYIELVVLKRLKVNPPNKIK